MKNAHREIIFAIDPGCEESAWIEFDVADAIPTGEFGLDANRNVAELIRCTQADHLVVEMVGHYGTGQAVGRTVFDACVWIGRFLQVWDGLRQRPAATMLRKTVVTHACGTSRAGDSNVRQAMIDRWEPTLKPRCHPKGILKGMTADIFQALALAAAYAELRLAPEPKGT